MQVTDTSRTNIAIYRGLVVLLQTSRPKHGINPICTPNPSGTGNPPRVPQRFERTEWIPPINIVMQQKPSEKRDHSRNPSFQRYRQRPDAGGTPPAFSASLNHVCAIISHCPRTSGLSDGWSGQGTPCLGGDIRRNSILRQSCRRSLLPDGLGSGYRFLKQLVQGAR
jgi:hypothetical protein